MSDLPPSDPPGPVAHLELKAALLLALFVALVAGTVLYLLYARGTFEATQRLVLLADDSEGVRVGMDLTFSGFPIGRVRRIELAGDGSVRILVDVPRKDAHWLRRSSVFTLVRSLVGSAALRAYSGIPTDPPLEDGAERRVLSGDTAAELPKAVSAARELMANLTALSAADAPLAQTLASLGRSSKKLEGPQGALGVLFGNEADARRVGQALARVEALLARLDGMAARADQQVLGADGLLARADRQVLGPDGLVQDGRAALQQLAAVLGDARATLKKVDAVLAEAQATASNVRGATTDLDALRREVDATVRKVEQLVDEVNRKWPFARDAELKLK